MLTTKSRLEYISELTGVPFGQVKSLYYRNELELNDITTFPKKQEIRPLTDEDFKTVNQATLIITQMKESDYKIHARSIKRMYPNTYMEVIEERIKKSKVNDKIPKVRTDTSLLDYELEKNYYNKVKDELEKL